MSNICIELGRIPPVGTPVFIKLGVAPIQPPPEREGTATALWNITAAYPVDPQAALATFPQGFAVAFAVSADELPSAVHGSVALSAHFRLAPQRILAPDDPLTQQIPDLNIFLAGDQQVPGQQGTGLRQPAVSQVHTMPWFAGEILRLAGAYPEAPEAPPVEALTVGTMSPLAPVPVVEAPAPEKVKKAEKTRTAKAKVAAATS